MQPYISPLEQFVKAILKQNNRKSLPTVYVKKALALVNSKLNSPCCLGDTVIDLYTSRNNNLTLIVEKLAENMSKKGNVHSLERTKKRLGTFIGLCCSASDLKLAVDTDTIDYTFNPHYVIGITNYTASLFDSTNTKIGSTFYFSSNLDAPLLSGSFTGLDAGDYYIKLVTNYDDGKSVLLTSETVTI